MSSQIAKRQDRGAGLRRWLERNRAFCLRHGGRRYYAELLDLYDECLAALDAPAR